MKKIFLLAALAMSSVMSRAASINVQPAVVDFGTVSIKGQALPMYGSQTRIMCIWVTAARWRPVVSFK